MHRKSLTKYSLFPFFMLKSPPSSYSSLLKGDFAYYPFGEGWGETKIILERKKLLFMMMNYKENNTVQQKIVQLELGILRTVHILFLMGYKYDARHVPFNY